MRNQDNILSNLETSGDEKELKNYYGQLFESHKSSKTGIETGEREEDEEDSLSNDYEDSAEHFVMDKDNLEVVDVEDNDDVFDDCVEELTPRPNADQ